MVRNGEHAESIITNCSAIKGNHAILLPLLCFLCMETVETSQDLFHRHTCKLSKKQPQIPSFSNLVLHKCSWSGCGVTSVAGSLVSSVAIGCLSQRRRVMAPAKSPGRAVTVQNNNRADAVFSLRLGGLQQILHFETRARLSTKDLKTLLQLAYYILVYFSSASKAHTNTHIITPRPKPEAWVAIQCVLISPGHLLMLLRSS